MNIFSGKGVWYAIAFTAGITIGFTVLDPIADGIEEWAQNGLFNRGA
jgi:hypothetical protein